MADLADVQDALGLMCQGALYPGQASPSGRSVAGVAVLIQKGWPDPNSLQKDMAAGRGQVSIYPQPTERNVTRYPREWKQIAPVAAHTFTLTMGGQTVIVGGAQPATFYPQNLAVFINGKPYLHQTQQTDTLAGIASVLAALIAVDVPGTTSAGPVISIPTPARIGALRVGAQGKVGMEVKRQERYFALIAWAADPAARDKIAAAIDAAIGLNQWLTLADGSSGRLIYKGSPFTDFDQKQGVYRRDLIVSVEYATIATATATEVVAAKTIIDQQAGDGSTITPPIAIQYN